MRVVWYIAKKDLMQAFTDRGALLILIAVPLVFIAVIGFALGNICGTGSSQITMTVALDNKDSGFVGTAVSQALHINTAGLIITVNTYGTSDEVQQQVKDGNVIAGVVVPAGATNTLTTAAQNNTPTGNLVQFYSARQHRSARADRPESCDRPRQSTGHSAICWGCRGEPGGASLPSAGQHLRPSDD